MIIGYSRWDFYYIRISFQPRCQPNCITPFSPHRYSICMPFILLIDLISITNAIAYLVTNALIAIYYYACFTITLNVPILTAKFVNCGNIMQHLIHFSGKSYEIFERLKLWHHLSYWTWKRRGFIFYWKYNMNYSCWHTQKNRLTKQNNILRFFSPKNIFKVRFNLKNWPDM